MLRKILVFVFLFALVAASAQADIIMVPEDYSTIQAAVDAANEGDTIMVGKYADIGAIIPNTKPELEIVGTGDRSVVNQAAEDDIAFAVYANGTKISNLKIECNGSTLKRGIYAFGANDVVLSHLTITNWQKGIVFIDGNGSEITHNNLSSSIYSGEGDVMGIDFSSFFSPANDNLIAFNKISYDGPTPATFNANFGIHAQAFKPPLFPQAAPEMKGNKIIHNNICVVAEISNGTWLDTLNGGIGIGDLFGFPDNPIGGYVKDNYVGFNDLRGSKNSDMAFLFLDESANYISRNIGADKTWFWYFDEEGVFVFTNPDTGENRSIDPKDAPNPADIYNPQPVPLEE